MINLKNFANWDVNDIPKDTVYEACNFSRTVPDTSGANPKGVRLFPGDDTPRTFINCNMINCEPPPGSTCTGCNHAISVYAVFSHSDEVWVDDVLVHSEDKHNTMFYGKYDPVGETYIYEAAPVVLPEDY